MSPLEWTGDKIQDVLIWLFNFASDHPIITSIILGWFFFCFVAVSVVRGIYPSSKWKKDERPTWARIIVLVCDPFVGNLWGILEAAFKKLGIKLPVPPAQDTLSLTLTQTTNTATITSTSK
jgi:hypothetical protein